MDEETCRELLEVIETRTQDVLSMQLTDTYKCGGSARFDVLAVPGIGGRDVISIDIKAVLSDGDHYEACRVDYVDDYIRRIDRDRETCPSELKGVEASQMGIARAVAHIFEERQCLTAPA